MYRRADPLALDPLGPMGIGPGVYPTSDALALDPLSPVYPGVRPIDVHASNSKHARDSARHSPPRDRARTGAKVTT